MLGPCSLTTHSTYVSHYSVGEVGRLLPPRRDWCHHIRLAAVDFCVAFSVLVPMLAGTPFRNKRESEVRLPVYTKPVDAASEYLFVFVCV